MAQKKIYISSTFRDLELYRKELRDTISFLQDYFTLVCPMEFMLPGSKESILQQCLDYVSACDIYIIIIGKRYGSVAPGTTKSFTEHEFDCAVSNKDRINIIPLIADESQEYLKGIEVDDAQKFAAFKSKVGAYLGLMFQSPQDLSKQLLLSLYRFSDNKWVQRESIDLRYYCNREVQVRDFKDCKKVGTLNVIAITCTKQDQADYFNRRMAKAELGLQKEYIEKPLRTSEIIGISNDYEKHKRRFLTSLVEKFHDPLADYPTSISECFDYFTKNKLTNIYIEFKLSKTDIENATVLNSLLRFLNELDEPCKNTATTLFFVIVFEYNSKEDLNNNFKSSLLPQSPSYSFILLEPLSTINADTVKDWMSRRIPSVDEYQTDKILNTYFPDLSKEYTMYEAFPLLGEIISDLKNPNYN